MSTADAIVALSAAEKRFQQGSYSLAGAVHEVIPNGVDSDTYRYLARAPNGPGGSRPWRLLCVGQLIKGKNVEGLLRACGRLCLPIEVSLVYQVDTCGDYLKRVASDVGLAGKVHFLGPKNPRDLNLCYQRADIFVLPSRAESLPSVITEAMVCGVPPIAFNIGGIGEQMNGFGIVAPFGGPEELAGAILRMIDEYPTHAGRGEEMCRYARARFSRDAMLSRHLELYERVIHRREPPRRSRTAWRHLRGLANRAISCYTAANARAAAHL